MLISYFINVLLLVTIQRISYSLQTVGRPFSGVIENNFIRRNNDDLIKNIFEREKRGLDSRQLDAVLTNDQSVLIIAGAGSGKTRILSSRLAHLLISGSCSPSEILILCFSNNAANKLFMRASELLSDTVATTTGVSSQTFHGFCAEILSKHISNLNNLSLIHI